MITTNAARCLSRSLRGQGRFYSTQAATISQPEAPQLQKQPAKLTKLDNGLSVASSDNASPLSRVGMVVRAGARYETPDLYTGVTHHIRNGLHLSTYTTHCLSVVREMERLGSNLTCTSDREFMFYTAECARENLEDVIKVLFTVTAEPLFTSHELSSIRDTMKLDLASRTPSVKLLDNLHSVAFMGGLSNSLFCPEFRVGNISSDDLLSYRLTHYTEPNMAFVGDGVDHDFMVDQAKLLPPSVDVGLKPAADNSKYIGGEYRELADTDLAYVALATEGPSRVGTDAIPAAVLQYLMGVGPRVKYSGKNVSRLEKAVSKATTEDFAVSCVNLPYSDTGLFGYTVVGNASEMAGIVRAATKEFISVGNSGNITDKEVETAKKQLKAAVAIGMECSYHSLGNLGEQALSSGKVVSLDGVMKMIDGVSTADVANVAKKIVHCKPSMSAVGNIGWTPRLAEVSTIVS